MLRVEAVGLTAAQCTNTYLCVRRIGLGKDLCENRRADACALMTRMNIQVVEKQALAVRPDYEEADPFSVDFDVPGMFRGEAREKALSGSERIKPPNALQTLAHGLDSEIGQRVTFISFRDGERDGECGRVRHRATVVE